MARAGDNYDLDKDLFSDYEPPARSQQFGGSGQPSASTAPTRPAGMTQKEFASQQRAAKARSRAAKTGVATKQRKNWEGTPEGVERQKNAEDFVTEQHNELAQSHPDQLSPITHTGMSVGQIYHARGWGQAQHGPGIGQEQLPGMENPAAAGTPRRWEELTSEEQGKTVRRLRDFGATPESMHRDFGAQVDQAYHRAQRHAGEGEAVPFSRDFYTTGEPAQRIHQSAEELGVDFGTHAAMNALTSPQTKFKQTIRGETRYPNDEVARHVVRQMQAGVAPEDLPATRRGSDLQGFGKNMVKAGQAYEHLQGGGSLRDVKGFGPKTGPYHNSWLPDTPDFLVSDVHTGGGGFFPHLSSEKPYRRDDQGNLVRKPEFENDPRSDTELPHSAFPREKSQREAAIERVPNFHSFADHVARNVAAQRGLGRIRPMQATQWGEEQIQRTQKDPRLALAKEDDVYRPNVGRQFDPNQGRMF